MVITMFEFILLILGSTLVGFMLFFLIFLVKMRDEEVEAIERRSIQGMDYETYRKVK